MELDGVVDVTENGADAILVLRVEAKERHQAELVDEISDVASAVHYAQDRYVAVEMTTDELKADAEAYLEKIDLFGFVARNCHNALF